MGLCPVYLHLATPLIILQPEIRVIVIVTPQARYRVCSCVVVSLWALGQFALGLLHTGKQTQQPIILFPLLALGGWQWQGEFVHFLADAERTDVRNRTGQVLFVGWVSALGPYRFIQIGPCSFDSFLS
jgi:hypothetical protein